MALLLTVARGTRPLPYSRSAVSHVDSGAPPFLYSEAMTSTLMQWIHVAAAVVGIGGIIFVRIILLPSVHHLNPEQRDLLLKRVMGRFRWLSWSAIILLLGSGLYNTRQVWEVPPGVYWRFLELKIALALILFAISFCLTLPFKVFERFRARRKLWLSIAAVLGMIVILISAYLRRG